MPRLTGQTKGDAAASPQRKQLVSGRTDSGRFKSGVSAAACEEREGVVLFFVVEVLRLHLDFDAAVLLFVSKVVFVRSE